MAEWHSMDTAPKDRLIICRETKNVAKRTKRVQWVDDGIHYPHWYSRDGGIMLPFKFDEWTEYDDALMPERGWNG